MRHDPPPAEPGYLAASRAPLHAFLAVAPLVLLHALGAAVFEPPVIAAAAGWVTAPLRLAGLSAGGAALVVAGAFVASGVALSARSVRRGRLRLRPFLIPLIWLEGAAWGVGLHLAWNGPGARPAGGSGLGPGDEIVLALGAGIYEELVFRLGLYAALLGILRLALRRAPRLHAPLAVVATSLIFAVAHHLGPEPFAVGAFAFRFVAALALTALLAGRGFGVAVTAHAAYDVAVGAPLAPWV